LNIDLSPSLKGKATLGSGGNTGIGLFFEKDY
jgi:translocation and assembly module TamB